MRSSADVEKRPKKSGGTKRRDSKHKREERKKYKYKQGITGGHNSEKGIHITADAR